MEQLKTTYLHDRHVALGALMSTFGGFDMPIQYKGIVEAPMPCASAAACSM